MMILSIAHLESVITQIEALKEYAMQEIKDKKVLQIFDITLPKLKGINPASPNAGRLMFESWNQFQMSSEYKKIMRKRKKQLLDLCTDILSDHNFAKLNTKQWYQTRANCTCIINLVQSRGNHFYYVQVQVNLKENKLDEADVIYRIIGLPEEVAKAINAANIINQETRRRLLEEFFANIVIPKFDEIDSLEKVLNHIKPDVKKPGPIHAISEFVRNHQDMN